MVKKIIILLVLLVIAGVGAVLFFTKTVIDGDIIVESPKPSELIANPLRVSGRARGTWFFEASAPVRIYDANGMELGAGPMQAQGEWMTADFVPFAGTIDFSLPRTETGTAVFKKDNPSGLPEYDKSYSVPVRFR